MRLAFASFFAAALFAVPFLSGAATPAPRIIMPEIRLPISAPPVSGPPINPTTTTLWLKPRVGRQVTLSSITESMTPQAKRGCVLFTITASLNAADAVTILDFYNKNDTIAEARDAAERIAVEYEPLPAVVDTAGALDPGQPAVWDEHPGNLCFDWEVGDEAAVEKQVRALVDVGVTEYVASIFGAREERAQTRALLKSML